MTRPLPAGPPPLLGLLWRRFSWRHWLLAPVQSALLVALLSLGVGVFLSIRLANRAAVASFQNFTDLLTAESDGLIAAPAGLLPESVLPELRRALGSLPVQIIPVLESTAARPRTREDEGIGTRGSFQIVGVDLIALSNLAERRKSTRPWLGQVPDAAPPPGAPSSGLPDTAAATFWDSFRDPRALFVCETLARAEGLRLGAPLKLIVNENVESFRIAGFIPEDPGQPRAPEQLLVMDLPALQRWTGFTGQLSRVEFVLEDGPRRAERWAEVRRRLESLATENGDAVPRWRVSSPADRRASGEVMTRAFRLNLTILSMLALVVGLYLVFQALDGAVVRRREEIAVLRSLGVPSRAIQRAWLGEAAVLGLAGGVLGIAIGWAGAQGAVRMVGRTVNALYYSSSADRADLYPGEVVLALAVSVLTSVLAGWLPARSAASTPPAQCLGRGHSTTFAGPALLRSLGLAWALAAIGLLLSQLPPWRLDGGVRVPWAAYGAAVAWTFAAGILGGSALRVLARLLERLARPRVNTAPTPDTASFRRETAFSWSAVWRLALSQVREPTGRHRLALAGLVCAVAMTAGMGILVGSFDVTMRGWIARTFQADLYVSSDGAQSASTENRISPATWRAVAGHPDVARAQILQATRLELPRGETMLVGADVKFFRDVARPAWKQSPVDDRVFEPGANRGLVLVSEAFSERFQLRRGDALTLPTPAGAREVTVAGVFSDYGNERGSILVDQPLFREWFGHDLASSVILLLRPGADAEAVRSALRSAHPGLAVFTQAHLRTEALRIFRQTFAITYALELIGVSVAVAGLGFTLVSLLWERRGELTTLRALGLGRREMAAAAALEGLLTAASGVAVGLVTSLALGWLLIHRVNQQTFGWTLETHLPWDQLALLALTVLVSAVVTAWWTGRWGAQLPAEQEE